MNHHRRVLLAGLGVGLGTAVGAAAAAASGATAPGRRTSEPELVANSGRDATLSLQRAIDAAAVTRRPLVLPPGRFLVSTVVLRSGTRLAGAGPATRIEHLGGGPALIIENAADVSVGDLTLSGGGRLSRGRGLIEAVDAERINLAGLNVIASPLNGIMLERCSGRMSGCLVETSAQAAVWSLDATGLEISHNTIRDCANNGILIWRSQPGDDGTLAFANRIERIRAASGGTGQYGNGINVFRAGGVVVSNNRITACAYSAIRANSASNVQILGNSAARIGEVALYSEFAFEGAVISGNTVDGAATGISVTNFNEGGRLAVVQGNIIRNLVRRDGHADVCGDGIAVEADAAVTGNVIEGAPTTGLVLGFGRYARDIAATGNVIRGCTVGIGVTADAAAGPVLVSQNIISGARDGAIRMLDHGRPTGPDLARAPAGGRIRTAGNIVS